MDDTQAADLLTANLEVLESAIHFVRRRHCLNPAETEELRGEVRIRLLERKALGAFQHRSSLRTYLTTIVHHTLQDLRNKRWQKWRPSVEAKRMGPVALRLEELLVRDGLGLDQAIEVLQTNHGLQCGRPALEELAGKLPSRVRRHFVGEDAIRHASSDLGADLHVLQSERESLAGRLSVALDEALNALDPEDRVVLKMRFFDGLRIVEVAKLLKIDPARLYRRYESLMRDLRANLERQGFNAADVADVAGDPSSSLDATIFADPSGIAAAGPSK